MPRTSIVVPSRGGAGRIHLLLDSLATQTDHDLEVVVVLDGDVDGSEQVLATRTDLPLRTIVFPENRGRSAALNAGFGASTGTVLVRCDDDLELPPSYVADRVRLHEAGAGGVIGLCRNLYPDTPFARAYGRAMDVRGREAAYAAAPDQAWRHWGASVSVTRTDFDAVGDYDPGYSRYGWEDVDWGYRLHLLGRSVVIRRELEAGHHIAATTTAVRAGRAFLSGRSRVRFDHKHGFPDGADERPAGTWGRLVSTVADRLDEDGVRRRGERVDATLDRLPRYLAAKRVALLVEAAALAGRRSADRDLLEGEPV